MTPKPGYILLVEDNPDDEELALLAFRQAPTRAPVVVARDGVQAVTLLQGPGPAGQGLPSLVFLDLKLPRLDGLEVLRWLRREPRTQQLPVVILSTSVAETDVQQCYGAGANSYLRKPVDFDQFVAMVAAASSYWLAFNVSPAAAQFSGSAR